MSMKREVSTLNNMHDKNLGYEDYKFDNFVFDDSFINYATDANQLDVTKWEKWLSQNPKNKETAIEALMLIRHLRFKKQELSSEFVNNEYLKLKSRLYLNETKRPLKKRTVFIRKMWQYAAAASILLLFVGAIYYFTSTPKHEDLVAYHEIIVPKGQIKKVFLPDGSTVYINSDSKLRYSSFSDKDKREVYLEGEAYFDVKHNPKKPFIVHAQEKAVTVLGTAFDIYAYPDENIYRASLERGEISISENKEVIADLEVNQTFVQIKCSKQWKISETANIKSFSSWKSGKLVFTDQKFTDILRVLGRTYNVNFKLQNKKVGGYRYTGSFTTKENIAFILGVIQLTTPFKYEIINDTVIIK